MYCLWRKFRRRPVPPSQRGPFINAQPQPCPSIVGSQWVDPSAPRRPEGEQYLNSTLGERGSERAQL
jgi:hypothetical protein